MRRIRKLVLLAAALAGAALVVATAAILWDGLHDEIHLADVALVLGNTVHPDGTPSDRLAARLDRTLELFGRGTFRLIIVSGALGKEGHDEATVMRDYLVSRGVPTTQVLVDSAGYTTFATAKHREHHARGGPRERVGDFPVFPHFQSQTRFEEIRDLARLLGACAAL